MRVRVCCPLAGLQLPPTMPVLFEQQGGILEPEKMIAAHVKVAQHHGARVATQEVVEGWSVLPDGLVEVETDKGTYRAERLVLSAGAWMDQLVPELQVSSTIQGAPVSHSVRFGGYRSSPLEEEAKQGL